MLGPFSQAIVEEVDRRFAHLLTDDLYVAAAILHPVHKLKWCFWTPEPMATEAKARATVLRIMNETNLSVTELKHVQDETTPLRSSLFDLGDSSENHDKPATESAETEFARYSDNRDRMKDPLQFFTDQ